MSDILVVEIIDSKTVVINKGKKDGITSEDKFLIYELREEIIDPLTNESLGQLRLKKGTAIVDDIQEKMTIITSDRFTTMSKKEKPSYGLYSVFPTTTEYTERDRAPFERDVQKGDYVVIYNRK
jgi:hypothetical protein